MRRVRALANDALGALVAGVEPELLAPPANALRVALHPPTPSWGGSTTSSPATPGCAASRRATRAPAGDIVVPLRLRVAERELAFFSKISTFGTPVDITLDELMIEAFYPANAATATYLLEGIGAPAAS